MRLRSLYRLPLVLAVALAASGCDGLLNLDDQPGTSESDLTFVRFVADAPPLTDTVVSFWAVRGQDRQVQIQYIYANGLGKCMLFRVPADALARHPDGRTVAEGDSVLITIRVPDKSRYDYSFSPAGLQFDANHPAELEVKYRWADRDLDGNGVVDSRDEHLWKGFAFWKQERPGQPWTRIETTRLEDILEARAAITSFTKYALAID
jgi:hypothetical protein